jgi:hypothetical protein
LDQEFAEPGVAFVHRTDRPSACAYRLLASASTYSHPVLGASSRLGLAAQRRKSRASESCCNLRPGGPKAVRTIPRVRRPLLLAAVLGGVLLVAGCGGTKTYDADKTRSCLADLPGVKIRNKVDFVASTALGGAFNVKLLGNQVTLVFGEDRNEAGRIVRAYQRFRGKNIGITDVLQANHNVVTLWEAHPSDTALQTIQDCLK